MTFTLQRGMRLSCRVSKPKRRALLQLKNSIYNHFFKTTGNLWLPVNQPTEFTVSCALLSLVRGRKRRAEENDKIYVDVYGSTMAGITHELHHFWGVCKPNPYNQSGLQKVGQDIRWLP